MKQPRLALSLMVAFTVVLGAVSAVLFDGLKTAFVANPALNTVIVCILVFGITLAFVQMICLRKAITWITDFRDKKESKSPPPTIIAPLAPAFGQAGEVHSLGTSTARTLLDGVFTRIDDGRDTSRYLMNTLILLGLLGTFWGLLQTVAGIGSVVGNLNVGDGDLELVFEKFKEGLQTPLVGMGVSFSASLFGLASSLILGFFDLTMSRAQSRFCVALEDWITAQPQTLQLDSLVTASAAAPARYQEAMIQNLADQLERLQKVFKQLEHSREAERVSVRALSEGVATLDDHLRTQQNVLIKLAELQQQVTPVLARLSEKLGNTNQETIEEHTRRIDLNLKEIGEKVSHSADTIASELRGELKIIAKILASEDVRSNA